MILLTDRDMDNEEFIRITDKDVEYKDLILLTDKDIDRDRDSIIRL